MSTALLVAQATTHLVTFLDVSFLCYVLLKLLAGEAELVLPGDDL